MASRASVQETASDVLETAEDKLGAFADKAYEAGREQAESVARQQTNAFKQFCLTVVRALRRGGDELHEEGYATVAGLVEDVANRAEELTGDIDDLDMRSATERMEDFVRERPMVAYGALALAGFLAASTLQTAARHRHEREVEASAKPARRRRKAAAGSGATTRKRKTS